MVVVVDRWSLASGLTVFSIVENKDRFKGLLFSFTKNWRQN